VVHHLNTQLLVLAVVGMVATVAALGMVATRRDASDGDGPEVETRDQRIESPDEQLMATSD
jgi:hypothetical protein